MEGGCDTFCISPYGAHKIFTKNEIICTQGLVVAAELKAENGG